MINTINQKTNSNERISFGPIHLKVTSIEKAKYFYTQIAGLKLLSASQDTIEFGTENETLVVAHQVAKDQYVKGYSGLYHFAIHVPSEAELASVINRLDKRGHFYSPVDHTMSKAVYFEDLDGITLEYTYETPERQTTRAQEEKMPRPKTLNVSELLRSLEDSNIDKTIDEGSFVGHIHLYANDVDNLNVFYNNLGFTQHTYKPEMVFADLGAGGNFGHRIAMNAWHGRNRPLAPIENAGLDYFQLIYKDKNQLNSVLKSLPEYQETAEGYWIQDPTGNRVLLN